MRNNRHPFLSYVIVVLLMIVQYPYAYGDTPQSPDQTIDIGDPNSYRSDQILITYDRNAGLDGLMPLAESISPLSFDTEGNPIALVAINDDVSVEEAVIAALADPGVIAAQPDYLYYPLEDLTPPNDPMIASWWWLHNPQAQQAWNLARSNGQTTVAVFDTGINIFHEDLIENLDMDHAWDAINERSLLISINTEGGCGELSATGHGTHVSGIIGAVADNGIGGAGISFNATILPIRVFMLSGSTLLSSTSTLINACDYLVDMKTSGQLPSLRLINMSLGEYNPGEYDVLFHNAIISAQNAGILTVAAGGNLGTSNAIYPSDWPEVLSVVVIDPNNNKPTASDFNENKDIAAPGVNVDSTAYSAATPSNNAMYESKGGSSMASGVVAGVACLVWAANPTLSVEQVKQILLDTAIYDVTGVPVAGQIGRVNAYQAVLAALSIEMTLNIQNGKWSDGTNTSVVLKMTKNDPFPVLPTGMLANTGYNPSTGHWINDAGNTVTSFPVTVSEDCAYTYVFDLFQYQINFKVANGIWSNSTSSTITYDLKHFDQFPTPPTGMLANAGYNPSTGHWTNAAGNTVTSFPSTVSQDSTYTYIYDLYQYKITFKVTNGTWFNSTYNTITYDLKHFDQFPTPPSGMLAGSGYDVTTGHWENELGDTVSAFPSTVTGNVTYTYTFGLKIVSPPSGYYTIGSGLGGNLVIDIAGASIYNQAAVTTYTNNHTVAQVFLLIFDPTDDCYIIKNPSSGKVLDVPGAQAYQGQSIWQYAPNGTDAQKWRLIVQTDGSYLIVSKLNSNLCLDVPGASTKPGTQLWLYQINGTNAQRFSLSVDLQTAVPTGVFSIGTAQNPSQVIDVDGASLLDKANIQLWEFNNTNAQKFSISFDPSTGMYMITNVGSNKAVDVAGAGWAIGTNVWQYTQNNTLAQRFYIEQTGNSYRIYASYSGLALDAIGANTVNGTNVWTYTPNGTQAQEWVIYPTS
jgi:subtilisin family serine protease